MRARNVLFFGFFVCYVGMCVVWDIWACPYHEERKWCGTKMSICLQGTPYSESLKFPGTKWGVRFP